METPVATTNPPLIVFDVNETLLDIDVLEPLLDRSLAVQGRARWCLPKSCWLSIGRIQPKIRT